jgi:hypothetical protein
MKHILSPELVFAIATKASQSSLSSTLMGSITSFPVFLLSSMSSRLGAVLHVQLGSYRVCPAPLPYQGKILVHKGANLCSPPAAVHHGGGPTPWHSLILTSLHKMSLWLLSPPNQLCQQGLLSIVRLCLLLISHLIPHNYFD